jgi:glycosyltransferase involved in cell wall biosynthesis
LVATAPGHHTPVRLSSQRRAPQHGDLRSDQPDPAGLAVLGRGPAPDRLRHRHVLIVAGVEATDGASAAACTTALAAHLAGRASSVTVLTAGRDPGPLFDPPDPPSAGLMVTRFRSHLTRRRGALAHLVGELGFAVRAMTSPRGGHPDLVVAITPGTGAAVAAARIASAQGAPLLVVAQDQPSSPGARAARRAAPGWLTRLEHRTEAWALRRATRVAVMNQSLAPILCRLGVPRERIAVLPHRPVTTSQVDRQTARRILGWRGGRFVVTLGGPPQMCPDLAGVAKTARLLHGEAELVVVAAGAAADAVATVADGVDNLHVVAPAGPEHRGLVLAASDLLLITEDPYLGARSLPSTLTAYFAAGRPVLAAVDPDGPTATRIAHSRGAGLVVSPGDPALLASAIRELRADDVLRAAMGRAGLVHTHQQLDRSTSLLALDALIDGVCTDLALPRARP